MHFELLLMTSRSGSSMIADIFVRHGLHWATNTSRNPVVGGEKVRYKSFENQVVKNYLKSQFGTPLGDLITYDDKHVSEFAALLKREYIMREGHANVWKGAVEFFPLWQALAEEGRITIRAHIVYREMSKVIESVLAKRRGRGDENEARRITEKRYEIFGDLATDYAASVILTDQIVAGDFSSLRLAFDGGPVAFDPAIATAVVDPSKWETER